MKNQLVLHKEEYEKLSAICNSLQRGTYAKAVFLIDKDGQLLASSGETQDLDVTSLASLTAGNIAATGGLAELLGEKEFVIQSNEGEHENVNISIVPPRAILLIIFDRRSNLGLVRLRVRSASQEMTKVLEEALQKPEDQGKAAFSDFTDDDIDLIFGENV
jgi:predicted regulator of Ras-like GTPase activity (Roadblock/LC7/MglB family)